ncbi:F0F1 ATP synthase subunit delta [Fervidibacillus halotolerans]|uniref:ATP synthase subunit delta n=1 Tax=Fervidibacillus halotolerans TaxID=2980027 RepID=A0A9E8M048_9BACI|nr:F0F1 ATP synthase subunit delta [Fervidibacillus halotolerans]WAA12176.1 F0F1 ATP synthase subunit delta [Fervidibacillus halotolerans]
MIQTEIGNKYGTALFQLAVEKNETDRIENELRIVKYVFESEKNFLTFLRSPKVSFQQKQETLLNVFADFSPYIINTLLLMIERHRIEHMIPMIEQFFQLSYEKKGLAVATVETVRPLTDMEKVEISKVFAKKVNKRSLEINNIVNTDLLGGVKIQIGNRIFDGSLRGKLDRLKRKLILNQSS